MTRKIGKNQVLALNVLLTSDGEALRRLADEGRLDEWIADNIRWARDTFGGDNVVGAALHMDERTPHLHIHIAVVPIVTTERKKKAREATAKKRYRTKAANRPRLCADDIMERGKMSRY